MQFWAGFFFQNSVVSYRKHRWAYLRILSKKVRLIFNKIQAQFLILLTIWNAWKITIVVSISKDAFVVVDC